MKGFELFNENANSQQNEGINFITGLIESKVIAINPTEEKLGEIIGEESAAKFNTDYGLEDNEYFNNQVRSLNFWIQPVDESVRPLLFSINIGSDIATARTGAIRVINDYNNATWSKTGVEGVTGNPKMAWFSQTGIREARVDEEFYYTFMQRWTKYDPSESIVDALKAVNADYDTLVKGNFSNLQQVVDYFNGKEMTFMIPYGIKETTNSAGDTVNRQKVINKINTVFSTPVDKEGNLNEGKVSLLYNKFQEEVDDTKERGKDYSILYYTIRPQSYVKEECIGFEQAPTTTKNKISWGKK